MVPADLGVAVELEAPHRLAHVGHQARGDQLLGNMADGTGGHAGGVGQERPQKPHGDELDRAPRRLWSRRRVRTNSKSFWSRWKYRPSCADVGSPPKRP